MSILIFFAVLFVLILVHEWGHFIVAKKTGMRVDEFGIGFPPKLFGIKKGETEYTFNALPIGGFVKILGEDGASAPSSPVSAENGNDRSERSEAGQGGQYGASAPSSPVSAENGNDRSERSEAGQGGQYGASAPSSPVSAENGNDRSERSEAGQGGQYGASAPSSPVSAENGNDRSERISAENVDNDYKRSFVAKSKWAQAAVLIAGVTMNVLFAWFLFVVVFMIGVPTAVDESVAGPEARLVVTEVLSDSPASGASVPVGAEVIRIESGDFVATDLTPTSFSDFISKLGTAEITLVYKVGEEEQMSTITPVPGLLENPNKPAVGIALSMIETKRESLPGAILGATTRTYELLVAITVGITSLLIDAVTFSADMSSVAGPVGIVSLVGDAAQFGFTSLLVFTALISLNLAVINLLPVPALDGGRLLFVAIEALIRRPINPVWMARVNFVGFAFLIMLMLAVTYNDILRLV